MEFNKLLETFRNWNQTSQDYEALLKWCYDNTDKLDLSNPDYKYLYETATQYLIAIRVGKFNEKDAKFLINYLAKDFAINRGIRDFTIEILEDNYKEKTGLDSVGACDYSSNDGHSCVYYSSKVIEALTNNNINGLLRWITNYFS